MKTLKFKSGTLIELSRKLVITQALCDAVKNMRHSVAPGGQLWFDISRIKSYSEFIGYEPDYCALIADYCGHWKIDMSFYGDMIFEGSNDRILLKPDKIEISKKAFQICIDSLYANATTVVHTNIADNLTDLLNS